MTVCRDTKCALFGAGSLNNTYPTLMAMIDVLFGFEGRLELLSRDYISYCCHVSADFRVTVLLDSVTMLVGLDTAA